MYLINLFKQLLELAFEFDKEEDINFLVDVFSHILEDNVCVNLDENYKLNRKNNFHFIKWRLPVCRKMYYLLTGRYPVLIDVNYEDNKINVSIHGRKYQFGGKVKKGFNNPILEIDITAYLFSYNFKESFK